MEFDIEKPNNKLLAPFELDSDAWVSEIKRIRGKERPLSAAGLHALRAEHTRSIVPARALVAESLKLELTLSDQPSLRPDSVRNRTPLANRAAAHADPAAT